MSGPEERVHEPSPADSGREPRLAAPGRAAAPVTGQRPDSPEPDRAETGRADLPPAEAAPAEQGPGEAAPAEQGPGEAAPAEQGSARMGTDLAKMQQDLLELTGDLQRLQAEYVNYKRRVDRDRELVREMARFSVLSALLPVLDDLDRAREHGELEGGFKAVADSLERTVAGMGLEKFGKSGDEFDPNLHEALTHSHSPDVTTTTCSSVVQAGYRIKDRVVRAALVTVVDPEPADGQPAEAQPAEAQPAEAQPADAQPAEAQPADARGD